MASKYLTDEYAATDFSYPYVQVVRGEKNLTHCGYFVPLSQAEKAGWANLNTATFTEYTYNNERTEVGVLLTKPRMILTPICRLGVFDRNASETEGNLVVIGEWDRKYRDDDNVGNFQIFLVMFFDGNNQPLHELPLKLVTKGAHQASLSEKWQRFCTSVARCQSIANKTLFRPRNEVFNTLCVFQPIITRATVGKKKKSACCYIDDYIKPTEFNWQQFFLGVDESLADNIIEVINPQPRQLLLPPTAGNIIALPPAGGNEPEVVDTIDSLATRPSSAVNTIVEVVTISPESTDNLPF